MSLTIQKNIFSQMVSKDHLPSSYHLLRRTSRITQQNTAYNDFIIILSVSQGKTLLLFHVLQNFLVGNLTNVIAKLVGLFVTLPHLNYSNHNDKILHTHCRGTENKPKTSVHIL